MKILFVVPGEARGHSMIFARRQAEALIRDGVGVELFHLRSRTSPARLFREFLRFRKTIRTFRPQVIHAHYGTVTALFAALGSGKIPLVITYRGSDLNRLPSARGLRPRVGHLFSQMAALKPRRIVCVSHGLRDRLWWRRSRVTVLPSGVDLNVFRPMPQAQTRRELGISEDARIVLFHSGGGVRNKRLDLAESALEETRRSMRTVQLRLLDGSVPPDLVPLLMNAADALLVTSDSEGSPTVIQEALATNLPVISVDVGDAAERLEGVSHSRVVERDPRALGRAVAEVLDPPRRSDGRRRAEEFSSERMAARLLQLYREAAEDCAGPSAEEPEWNSSRC